ncbi:integrator complex subunit 15 [Hyperolius riggenbachi]|uniref:integrator complex subunit 15 n=1 Tax=Hyperolius riggenbachi TaxID=752182 RepID=UPI0035A2A83D
MSDIRHSLLRRDALSAAKEVLYHLDVYFSSQLQNAPVPLVDKGPIELLEEFIFQVPKDRSSHGKRLTAIQELQLLEMLCNYFQEQSKEAVRQVMFNSLFSPQGNKADEQRMALLGKLTSMAVAVCKVPVLESAASWLQRTPAVYCVRLAKALVDDYCGLVPGSIQTLKQIFSVSPRFCCQFITAVTALYDLSTEDLLPPHDLLEMIVSWIFEDPRLILITFLNTPITANLPIGFLDFSPLLGLVRWCVTAPLAYRRKQKAAGGEPIRDNQTLYSKLHLSVLQGLMVLKTHLTEKGLYGRLALLLFEQLVPLVEELEQLCDELNPLNAEQDMELALDRLAQALQVSMATGALLCTRDDLRTLCSRLPHNNLMQLVVSGPVQPAHPTLAQPAHPTLAQPAHPTLTPAYYPHIHTPPLGYPTLPTHASIPAHTALSTHTTLPAHAALPAHTPIPAHAALPTHAALSTHSQLPGHPVQTFMTGMNFQFRPMR